MDNNSYGQINSIVDEIIPIGTKAQNQAKIGEIIRKNLFLNSSLEFYRYKESSSVIKFTCRNSKFNFFGKVRLNESDGIISKLERYPRYSNAIDYLNIIVELHEKGKTQKQISHRLCLSQATISRIIREYYKVVWKIIKKYKLKNKEVILLLSMITSNS